MPPAAAARVPPPVRYDATASRPAWADLPAGLRRAIEDRLGDQVTTTTTAGGGFTRGFAGVLTTTTGQRSFVKAARLDTQRYLVDSYYHEVQVTLALPAAVPAPRPRWTATADGWYTVCLEAVDGAMPRLPWRRGELAAALEAWAIAAQALREPPAELTALGLPRLADLLRTDLSCWAQIRTGQAPKPPAADGVRIHLAELCELEAALPGYADTAGLTHCDLRLDNVLIGRLAPGYFGHSSYPGDVPHLGSSGSSGDSAWICDWNWICHGAPWFDTAGLLITAYASGLDADQLFASHPTALAAPADALDASLASLAGYLLCSAEAGPTDASPTLRAHQRWSGETALAWLADRRGWDR